MEDSFFIGAYWGPRSVPLIEIVTNTIKTLKKLGELDEQFLDWYELGMRRKQALTNKVIQDTEGITKLYSKSLGEFETKSDSLTDNGFVLGLWTGHREEESSRITFTVGLNSKRVSNCCVLKLPFEGKAKDRLVTLTKARSIVELLVDIWDPDFAIFTSHNLVSKLSGSVDIGWITYRKVIKKGRLKNERIINEKYKNGNLFILDSMNFDAARDGNELRSQPH
jgi:hypothetical protein